VKLLPIRWPRESGLISFGFLREGNGIRAEWRRSDENRAGATRLGRCVGHLPQRISRTMLARRSVPRAVPVSPALSATKAVGTCACGCHRLPTVTGRTSSRFQWDGRVPQGRSMACHSPPRTCCPNMPGGRVGIPPLGIRHAQRQLVGHPGRFGTSFRKQTRSWRPGRRAFAHNIGM